MKIKMGYPKAIENIRNENEKNVARLFHDLEFTFIDANYEIQSNKEKIGEIDLLVTFDKFLFLIEVTTDNHDRTRKKLTYFAKWGKENYINSIRKKYDLPTKKIVRVYFDLSKKSLKDESDAVSDFLKDSENNVIAYKDDYDYFVNSVKKIGGWAKNDFLDWAGIKGEDSHKDIRAIQYYLQDIPVYCFVERVDSLLNACYISRRRRSSPDPGYQRTLNERRISQIQKNIEKGEGLAFPNSILIYTPKLADKIYPPDECPKELTVRFPTRYCSCRIIDGQHRLLGFSKLNQSKLEQYFLTVIALPELQKRREFRTFIDINSKQQKMDNNLILHLKSDFKWDEGSRERLEQIGVRVAEKLNEKILKDRIFFGTADEPRGDKITLVTLVSSLRNNNQILENEEKTYKKVSNIFASIGKHMPDQLKREGFFNQNRGIRILFRLNHLYERNMRAHKISVSQDAFYRYISKLLDPITIDSLNDYYGGGGATAASKELVKQLQETNSIYQNMQGDLKGI